MTLLDRLTGRDRPHAQHPQRPTQSRTNVGPSERAVSVAAGSLLTLLGVSRRSLPGIVVATVGGGMLARGLTGYCPASAALGLDTRHDDHQTSRDELAQTGITVRQTFLVSRPAADLYQFWRNFENLPSFMTHLQSVKVLDDRKSHWVASAPRLAGGSVEWDAEITDDQPNARIAWRSLPGADVDNAGEIRFQPAPGDRGTEVHVALSYLPPAGRIGHWLAKMFGESADTQVREDLRSFKRLIETGEIPTTAGQPHGTCTGRGTRS
jgi:uncharacterized membrane protein